MHSRADGLIDSIMSMVWRRRAIVAACTLLALPVAALYLLLATPLYTTTASLMLQRSAIKYIRDGEPQAAVPDNDDYLYTQQRVISSTPVMAAALAAPGVRQIEALRNKTNDLSILRRGVSVDVGKKDQLISIAFDSAKPSDGVTLVGAIVDAYTRFNASLRHNASSEILAVVKEEKTQADSDLSQQEHDLLAYGESHGLSATDNARTDVNAQRLQALSDALTAARLERVNAQSAYDEIAAGLANDHVRSKKVKAFLASSGAVLPSTSDDTLIRQELMTLKNKQSELQQTFGPKYPAIVSLQHRIDELDIAFAAGVEHRLDAARQREAELQQSFDEQQKIGFQRAGEQDEFNRRQSEVDQTRKLIDKLDDRIKEAALTEDGGIPSVTTIDPPRASDFPTKPEKTRTLVLALLAGFLIGSGIAIGKEWGQIRVSTQAVSVSLGVPVIGEMPPLSPHSTAALHGQKLLIDSGAGVSEACRQLHDALAANPPVGRGATVLVTSPSRGDGKSTLAVNMAISLAGTGKRVLLVDADFRAPSLGQVFNIDSATGLGTLLESSDPLPVTAIHHTGTPWLDLILSGPTRRNPSELLNGQHFIDLLGDLAERYDYVLLDSPPVVTYTDARTIAASCDATLLVIRGQAINRPLFERARQGLMNVGANLAGVIINGEVSSDWSDATGGAKQTSIAQGRLLRTMRTMATAVNLM